MARCHGISNGFPPTKIAFAQLGDLEGNSIIVMCLFVCWKNKWKKHISWLINIFPIRLFGDVPYDCKISHVACFMNAHQVQKKQYTCIYIYIYSKNNYFFLCFSMTTKDEQNSWGCQSPQHPHVAAPARDASRPKAPLPRNSRQT